MPNRDSLFLLPPGFLDNNRREFCPECAEIQGLLSWFPAIRDSLRVFYQPIEKPRAQMIDLLGVKNQNCPTLILSEHSPVFDGAPVLTKGGIRFINNARGIATYYACRFGTPFPRGS